MQLLEGSDDERIRVQIECPRFSFLRLYLMSPSEVFLSQANEIGYVGQGDTNQCSLVPSQLNEANGSLWPNRGKNFILSTQAFLSSKGWGQ